MYDIERRLPAEIPAIFEDIGASDLRADENISENFMIQGKGDAIGQRGIVKIELMKPAHRFGADEMDGNFAAGMTF